MIMYRTSKCYGQVSSCGLPNILRVSWRGLPPFSQYAPKFEDEQEEEEETGSRRYNPN
jgi:hypothetical protein